MHVAGLERRDVELRGTRRLLAARCRFSESAASGGPASGVRARRPRRGAAAGVRCRLRCSTAQRRCASKRWSSPPSAAHARHGATVVVRRSGASRLRAVRAIVIARGARRRVRPSAVMASSADLLRGALEQRHQPVDHRGVAELAERAHHRPAATSSVVSSSISRARAALACCRSRRAHRRRARSPTSPLSRVASMR